MELLRRFSGGRNGSQQSTARGSSSKPTLADPATCAILPGRDTVIELNKGFKPLGIDVIGGSSTFLVRTVTNLKTVAHSFSNMSR